MTLLDKLQSHKGGLLRLRTQLYWYNVGDWDNNPGRVCLVLDAAAAYAAAADAEADGGAVAEARLVALALLLIDGSTRWVWVAECDVEVLG